MPHRLSLASMKSGLRTKIFSAVELLDAHLAQIAKQDPKLKAFVRIMPEQARATARAVDDGTIEGPLAGIPVTIKDSLNVAGQPTLAGSKLRIGHIAETDSYVAARLRAAGAVIIGKTNCPEFLMNYETDNFITGRTANPWNPEFSAGGSSGGEAAAIASFCSAGGIGSDGGGSIRAPAHFCGIAGLKPTPGRIPATGHVPECLHPGGLLGVVGPMARNAEDLKILFQVLAGFDDQDPFSVPMPVGSGDIGGVTVGIWEQFYDVPVLPSVQTLVRKAGQDLASAGISVREFNPKGMEKAPNVWDFFFTRLSEPFLRKLYEGRTEEPHWTLKEFWAETPREYTASQVVEKFGDRDRMRALLLQQMQETQLLISPVMSVPAFRPRERSWDIGGKTIRLFDSTKCMTPFNLLGFPAAVIPYGFAENGMPVGIQIVGRPWEEDRILSLAVLLEQIRGPFPPCPL